MTISIEDVIRRIPDWRGKHILPEPLSGGLTNTNYKVTVDEAAYFVRVPGEDTDLLAINRKNEHYNTSAAADSGVGPKVLYHLPDFDVMVIEFIHGETMSNQRFQAPEMPQRIARSLKMLHSGRRFLTDFNMFRLTEFYLDICKQHDVVVPDGYWERMPTVQRIEAAMAVQPIPTVPCNNDLLAENYIDDGNLLRLIDYEYSGNNDPTFELGNTCQELGYDDERIHELCEAYFGRASSVLLARMMLNMVMSDVGWGLWAAIQEKISTIEYDFWGWATERWGRAITKMDSLEFPRWLEDVQLSD